MSKENQRPIVDNNNFEHPGDDWTVVDSNGGILSPPRPRRQSTRTSGCVAGPTKSDMDNLELAVFKHGDPYLGELMKMYKQEAMSFDVNHSANRVRYEVLLTCWVNLKWRPSTNGDRVIRDINPYKKK
jgi:hypothetical protein